MFDSLRHRICAVGLVHNPLMGSSNLSQFDGASFLQERTDNLMNAHAGNISMRVHATPMELTPDFAVSLGLLVTELVTNALKHAFPNGNGAISVTLDPSGDRGVDLVVADDGCGFLPDETRRTGLGNEIVKAPVAQLGGRISYSNPGGSRFEIYLPRPGTR